MKTNKYFNIAAGLAMTLGLGACSSDYLDLAPESSLTYEQAVTDAQGANLAVRGLCQSMYKQWSSLYDYNNFNGEPWIQMFYGDIMGSDYISLYWMQTDPESVRWTSMNMENAQGASAAWAYCYSLISQANNIISFAPKKVENGEEVLDVEGEYAFRVAQALTMRAHAYTRLMQIYAPRWDDRFNDENKVKLTVPLRLKYEDPEGDLSCPLSPMDVVVDQIYADLDQALELYDLSNFRRSFDWEPDKQIAQGIYSRIAMLRNDYPTAQKMAHDARQGYEIMTSEDYEAGFAYPTSEWMWTNSGEPNGVFFASFGASYACNGAYPCRWGVIGAGAIDQTLISAALNRDRRTSLFFSPRNVVSSSQSKFWSESVSTSTLNINTFNVLHSEFLTFAQSRYNYVKDNGWTPPYTYYGAPLSDAYTMCYAQFGAQFKFWGTDGYSSSYFPFMRASELLLTEAEAAYMQDDQSTALSLLNQLNAKRITNYRDQNYSGEELLNNIKICRRLELWGEGYCWFDLKRWNEPMIRKFWSAKDTSSGNWPAEVIQREEYPTDYQDGWRWWVPALEINYNDAIDKGTVNTNQ